ncbi:MAG: HyaD/HybD family hydrogenase maturation endopeptidase [Acidobacteriaceae bacterium]
MNSSRIAVLGLGNLMRTDDAVGMLALQQLRAHPCFPRTIPLIDGGTLGLDLLYPLDGVTHLLALDAIDAGAPPGTLLRYEGDNIDDLPIAKSVHLLGFSDLIGALRLIGAAPSEIVVLGVQPQAIQWGTQLTPVVETAMALLVESAFAQIVEWTTDTGRAMPLPLPVQVPVLQAAAEESWYW